MLIPKRYLILGVLATAVTWLLLAIPGVAGALEVGSDPAAVAATTVTLDPLLRSFLAGAVTPLLAGLITKLSATTGVKALAGIVLVAVAAVVNAAVTGDGTVDVKVTAYLFATTLIAHVAAYYGVWKPAGGGVSSPAQLATKNTGVG